VFKYVSFFKYFKKEYEGWKSGVITASYYWSSGYAQTDMMSRILLQILIASYEEVDGMAHEYVFEKELNKSNNIENSILKLDEIFSKEDLRKRHPNVSDATIDRTLKRLKDEDKIRPLGKGRSSKWQRIVSGNRKFGIEQLSLFND
jgi:predicted HTH transcriptional regulator